MSVDDKFRVEHQFFFLLSYLLTKVSDAIIVGPYFPSSLFILTAIARIDCLEFETPKKQVQQR